MLTYYSLLNALNTDKQTDTDRKEEKKRKPNSFARSKIPHQDVVVVVVFFFFRLYTTATQWTIFTSSPKLTVGSCTNLNAL